jgi:hypothetical protein
MLVIVNKEKAEVYQWWSIQIYKWLEITPIFKKNMICQNILAHHHKTG